MAAPPAKLADGTSLPDPALTNEPEDLVDVLHRAAAGEVAFEDVIEQPVVLEPKPRTLVLIDRRHREHGRPWHVLGIGMLILLVGMLTILSGRGLSRDFGAMTVVFAVAAVAIVLIVRGRPKRTLHEIPLAWLDSNLRLLRVREHPEQEELTTSSNIAFDEVREVLYAQRRFQVPGAREDGRVDGAALFLRLWDGAVWPLIPATLARQDAYTIALGIAQRIGVGVKQVGAGWSDPTPPRD